MNFKLHYNDYGHREVNQGPGGDYDYDEDEYDYDEDRASHDLEDSHLQEYSSRAERDPEVVIDCA